WWLRTRSEDLYRGQFQTMYVAASEGYTTFPYHDGEEFVDNAGVISIYGTINDFKYGVRPAIMINRGYAHG
ncbi:MAG: hypothetical protein FWD36_09935, partial [Treponema sp.]|nr:hypothetical protein [Treponema sp.]